MKQSLSLRKMPHSYSETSTAGPIQYRIGEIQINEFLGKKISLRHLGKISCINCGREVKKTFNQGYCFPCSQKLAACDLCILKPELCHFRQGTCREPDWAKRNCLIDHVVYLSNTTGLKIGITRGFKKFERWGDQGATEALELAVVPERLIAGLMEVAIAKEIDDKSDWRKLLKGERVEIDLLAERERVGAAVPDQYQQYLVRPEMFPAPHHLEYPVLRYPKKAVSLNFDKTPVVEGELLGVRGQYLLFESGGINIRKFAGYEVEFEG